MKLNLRNRFLLPMVVLILLGMGISGLISYEKSKTALEGSINAQISQLADSTAKVMGSWVRDRGLDIKTWSKQKVFQTSLNSSFVGKAARKSANALLADLMSEYGYYENIVLADTGGNLLAAAVPEVVGKINVKDRKYFLEASGGNLFTSDVMKSRQSGNPVFVIAHPVVDKEKIVGIVFGVIDLSIFNRQFIDTLKIGETGYAYIYDGQGRVLAHPDKSNILKLNMNEFDFGKEMISLGSGLIRYRFKGVEKIVGFQKDAVTGWTVGVGAATSDMLAPVIGLRNMNALLGAAIVAAAVLIILFVVRSIVRPINTIVDGLNQGAEQVASASGQVASSSQSLAAGSSQQAAAIEETSSSLEEMASMTKQNAEHSDHANTLMKEVNSVVDEADRSMTELNGSMEEISKASEETSKIIKTIDEIAFQTNLLALNAAVEAARAGEAGAGFAVVADEVRNLAMRAADAAGNTAQLIEGTVKKIKTGTELVKRTNTSFERVSESAGKVGELVEEIAAASNEQAQGIAQVNKAVSEMDKVVQQNAASAEESASASEEMTAQSQEMRRFVKDLVTLVTGDAAGKLKGPADAGGPGSAGKKTAEKKLRKSVSMVSAAPSPSREGSPERLIPLDDGDFEGF